jgi:hypothetical protein
VRDAIDTLRDVRHRLHDLEILVARLVGEFIDRHDLPYRHVDVPRHATPRFPDTVGSGGVARAARYWNHMRHRCGGYNRDR